MKKIIVIVLLLNSFSCEKTDKIILEGTVYIKLINVESFYGASKKTINTIKNSYNNNNQKKGDTIFNLYSTLIKHDLIDKPYFKIKTKDSDILNIYTNESEYQKVKKYLHDLDKDKYKITVKLSCVKKEDDIYFTNDIISVEKEKGKTDWEK